MGRVPELAEWLRQRAWVSAPTPNLCVQPLSFITVAVAMFFDIPAETGAYNKLRAHTQTPKFK